MIVYLQRTAEAFRMGAEPSASALLIEMLNALEQVVAHPGAQFDMPELGEHLDGVMAAQIRCDWTGAADILEYQLLPLLDSSPIGNLE